MLKRLLLGAFAGALATLPMTAVVWGFRRAGLYQRRPGPEAVTENTAEQVHPEADAGEQEFDLLTMVNHFGVGAAFGVAYGLVTLLLPATALTGVLAGLGIWKAGYDGVLPAIGVMPPPEADEQGRAFTMVAAHVVYGATLGELSGRLTSLT